MLFQCDSSFYTADGVSQKLLGPTPLPAQRADVARQHERLVGGFGVQKHENCAHWILFVVHLSVDEIARLEEAPDTRDPPPGPATDHRCTNPGDLPLGFRLQRCSSLRSQMGQTSQLVCVRACVVLLAVRLAGAAAAAAPLAGSVIALTDRNFDSLVNHTAPWMIDIYAPW